MPHKGCHVCQINLQVIVSEINFLVLVQLGIKKQCCDVMLLKKKIKKKPAIVCSRSPCTTLTSNNFLVLLAMNMIQTPFCSA